MTIVHIKQKSYHLSLAQKEDLPAIVAIYNQGTGTANANLAPVSVASRQAWFMAHGSQRPLVVLKDEDVLVAWASLSDLYEDRPAYRHSAEISIYVDDAYHGLGIGAYLLQDMLGRAKLCDIHKVVALIFAHNVASLSLFDKFGFDLWGVLPKICLSFEQMTDVLIMGKDVQNQDALIAKK